MLTLTFAPFGPPRPPARFVPPPGMRLQEYVLAYDEGRRQTVYVAAHGHGAAFGDVYVFDGEAWTHVAKGSRVFPTAQKLFGFYDEARGGVAVWSFKRDFANDRFVTTSLLLDVRNGLSPIATRGQPVSDVDGVRIGTFDYRGIFATDPTRAVTVCLTRRGVWELDADAVWRQCARHDASFPVAWDDDGAGAAFDPVRRRVVFWLFTRAPSRDYAFFAWDGRKLVHLPTTGLPVDDLHMGLAEPAALVGAHPVHGIVLLAGAHGAFAGGGERWTPLPAPRGEPPPRMRNARMIYDARLRGLVVGPGYHEGDPTGGEPQRVFYVERGGVFTRMGEHGAPSPLAELAPALHAFASGAWTAASATSLRTVRWTDGGFAEVVTKNDGEAALGGDRVGALVACGDRALAVTRRGAVLALDGDDWKREGDVSDTFGARSNFAAAWDEPGARLVAFGGAVEDRPTNDTLFYEGGAWRAAKAQSPLPPDRARRDFVLAYDAGLGRVVRFGKTGAAVLDGDRWQAVAPEGYAALAGERAWEHFPAHDRATGETLLVNLSTGVVWRFDLAACAPVAKLEIPAALAPKRSREGAPRRALVEAFCFDPGARLLHAQNPDERSQRWAVDLGPAFDAARAVGPRARFGEPEAAPGREPEPEPGPKSVRSSEETRAETAPASATREASIDAHVEELAKTAEVPVEELAKTAETPAVTAHAEAPKAAPKEALAAPAPAATRRVKAPDAAVRLYHPDRRAYWFLDGMAVRAGTVGARAHKTARVIDARAAVATKRKAGFVRADELDLDALAALGASESRALSVGDQTRASKTQPTSVSRCFGLPSGVASRRWPKKGREPLGFLLQIDCRELLRKYAGVAVFCATDGTAAEDESSTVALLLTAASWKKKPVAAPRGAPTLPPRPLAVGDPLPEIDEPRVRALAEADPAMGPAFERFRNEATVQRAIASKLGGSPAFLRSATIRAKYKFIAQVDFDGVANDWGLAGRVYVFVHPNEKDAIAFWQRT